LTREADSRKHRTVGRGRKEGGETISSLSHLLPSIQPPVEESNELTFLATISSDAIGEEVEGAAMAVRISRRRKGGRRLGGLSWLELEVKERSRRRSVSFLFNFPSER